MRAVESGTQETLTLFASGAYKSATTIVDPAAFRASWAGSICRNVARSGRKGRCDERNVDKQVAAIAKSYPSIMIGTYVVDRARIEFTHGCAEGVDGCSVGERTDRGIVFLEGESLTIKLDGIPYKGKVVGGSTTTYLRQP